MSKLSTSDICILLEHKTGVPKNTVKMVLYALSELIEEKMKEGVNMVLWGFCRIKPIDLPENKKAWNAARQTHEYRPSWRKISITPLKSLKKKVNGYE